VVILLKFKMNKLRAQRQKQSFPKPVPFHLCLLSVGVFEKKSNSLQGITHQKVQFNKTDSSFLPHSGESRNFPYLQPNSRLQVLAGEYFKNFKKMAEKGFYEKCFCGWDHAVVMVLPI
jgi:hypothetical protein